MNSVSNSPDRVRITEFFAELNSCWQQGKLDELHRFYHENVILLPPDDGIPIIGREAVVGSYREFDATATLRDFRITKLSVYTFDNSASAKTHVVHMDFEVEYDLDALTHAECGLEVYTLIESEKSPPQIIWRRQSVTDTRTVTSSGPG